MTGAQGLGFCKEDAEAKKINYLIGYSLHSCLMWEILTGCCDCLFLRFTFSDSRAPTMG